MYGMFQQSFNVGKLFFHLRRSATSVSYAFQFFFFAMSIPAFVNRLISVNIITTYLKMKFS